MKPSNIQPPPNHSVKVCEVQSGLFVVENAYEGQYGFFEGLASELRMNERRMPTESRRQDLIAVQAART
jgi:hypothetical protein